VQNVEANFSINLVSKTRMSQYITVSTQRLSTN